LSGEPFPRHHTPVVNLTKSQLGKRQLRKIRGESNKIFNPIKQFLKSNERTFRFKVGVSEQTRMKEEEEKRKRKMKRKETLKGDEGFLTFRRGKTPGCRKRRQLRGPQFPDRVEKIESNKPNCSRNTFSSLLVPFVTFQTLKVSTVKGEGKEKNRFSIEV